jgi:hypothetical protein
MKDVETFLKTISEGLKSLAQGVEGIAGRLEELAEAGQWAAPAAAPPEITPQQAPEGRGRKRKASREAGPHVALATATDSIYRIISRSRNGVDTAALKRKTGFNDKKIHNIVYKLKKKNKIRSRRKGLYVKA